MADKNNIARSTTPRFLAAGVTGAHVLCLSYWRPGKMPGQRLVEWLKFVAIANPTTFQPHFVRHYCAIQIRAADPRNFNLSDRAWLTILHLDKEDPLILVDLHFGNARGYWAGNGNVSLRTHYDRSESCRVWPLFWSWISNCDLQRCHESEGFGMKQ